jgi:hypothetical protein
MTNPPGDPPEPFDDSLYGGVGPEDDDMFNRREARGSVNDRRQRGRPVSEFVRKAIDSVGGGQGVGALSKDALQYILQQGDRSKREILRIVANEVGEFLRNVDLSSEVVKVLTGIQLEVNASIRFKPTKDGKSVKPSVETQVVSDSVEREAPTDPPRISEPPPAAPSQPAPRAAATEEKPKT